MTVDDYLAAVLELGEPCRPTSMPLAEADGAVLAQPLIATFAVPPFDNSAMDGFALRAADVANVPVELPVVADVPAGTSPTTQCGPGQAIRIMTGAPVPVGADAIVPVELTNIDPGPAPLPASVTVRSSVSVGRHIRKTGEDVPVGGHVLDAGITLDAASLAAAASIGYSHVLARRPKVLVISTGSELARPGVPLQPGQIPDSNSILLTSLVRRFGALATARSCSDSLDSFAQASADASDFDLVVTSGGVSAGAFEVVRQATSNTCRFVRVAMQPGKPQGLGHLDGTPFLAFPGNPVSVFVSAWLFARPLIAKLALRQEDSSWITRPCGAAWTKPAGRTQFLPALLDETVIPAHRLGSGSHAIGSLHLANCLARVPSNVERVTINDPVEVLPL